MSLLVVTLASLFFTTANCWKPALLIVDVQNCFVSGGSLAVPDGDAVVPIINKIRKDFFSDSSSTVVISQDWHCMKHISFVDSHPGRKKYDTIKIKYRERDGRLCGYNIDRTIFTNTVRCDKEKVITVDQVMWPVHCVSGTPSANFVRSLVTRRTDIPIFLGPDCEIEGYSLFSDNAGLRSTGLEYKLKDIHNVDAVFVTGLALDYCVYYTAMDAQKLGFETYIVLDATRGVAQDTSDKAMKDMKEKGIHVINSTDIADVLHAKTNFSSTFRAPGRFYLALMACVCFILM